MSDQNHYPAIGLHGKVAILTGASRGIGRATAFRLVALGARLVITGMKPDLLARLSEDIAKAGGTARWHAGDVADPDTAAACLALAEDAFGPPDILVNNAGMNLRISTTQMDMADWDRMLAVNLTGALHFARAVIPAMSAIGAGAIVNVSSVAAKTPHSNAAPAYGVSKAGINALTQHLALELAPLNIRVNAVCPGPIQTDMTADWTPEYHAQVLAKVPLGRLGMPEEMADVIAFLASPMSGFLTGETINANGGTYMN